MATFDEAVARDHLGHLIREFEEGSRRFPHFGHFLVEAPRERAPGHVGIAPESSDGVASGNSTVYRVHRFRHDGPPARTHYYFADVGRDGEDGEVFRKLAGQAAARTSP